jgi:predicted DNA-binding transcriptional regulator YafY
MRADRLLTILLLLHAHERLTTPALAERLAVSPRTIHRDLEALAAAGIPVYAERGRRGGWRLVEGYRAQIPPLSASELGALTVLGASDTLAGLDLGGALQQALHKLSAALPRAQQDAAHIAQRLHIEAGGWFQASEPLPWLEAVQQAVWHDQVLQMTYTRADGSTSPREVAPYGLVVQAGVWYLVGDTAAGLRVFRLGRVQQATPTGATFTRPADFDLAAAWRDLRGQFLTQTTRYPATVRIHPDLFPIVRQVLGLPADLPVTAEPDGWLRVVLAFDSLEAAQFHVLGFGAGVEAVAPPALRAAVRQEAAAVLRRYGTGEAE